MPKHATPVVRRKWDELHQRDQQNKTNRKTRIMQNWDCDIQLCIPLLIRPRVELKKGAKIRVGDISGVEEIWYNWSVEVLRGIEELSTLMAGKLEVAQEVMLMEVRKRQSDPKHPQRRVAELLLGDIQRIVDTVKRDQAKQAAETQEVRKDPIKELEIEPAPSAQKTQKQPQRQSFEAAEDEHHSNGMSPPLLGHGGRTPHQVQDTPVAASHMLSSPASRPYSAKKPQSIEHLNASLKLQVMDMRTRAYRLRAQAMRLEAEAFDMESNAAIARKALNTLNKNS